MIKVLLFDLNGTLLDTSALAPQINPIFKRRLSVDDWFARVLEYSMAATLVGEYREFGHIAIAVLQMTAAALRLKLSSSDIHKVQAGLHRMPPFHDVKSGLKSLRVAGFRLAVLTNSSPASLSRQLECAGIADQFEAALSVHDVARFKPAPEPYEFAARTLGVQPSEILMVAAHHWDLWGASRAGFQTAFLQRPNRALFPEAPSPQYMATDLKHLAAQLDPQQRTASFAKPAAFAVLAAAGLLISLFAQRVRS